MYRGILLFCLLVGLLLAVSTPFGSAQQRQDRAANRLPETRPAIVAVSPLPAWNRKGERDLSFFKGKGFSFEVDDSSAMHYEKPTVEICVIFPEEIDEDGLQHTFTNVSIDSEEINSVLGPHAYNGRKRIILTMSRAFAEKSQLWFYFSNDKTATEGVQYQIGLAKIMDDWKLSKRSNIPATKGPRTRP